MAELKVIVERLERQLVACQRLAMLGNLAGMAAHEFRNLMTPVVARTEAALSMADDVGFMRKTIERTLEHSRRAIEVTNHLLALARGEELATGPCLVAESVRTAIETTARPLDKDGIELRVQVPAELRVDARSELFCQVLLNLLLNARAAMKDRRGSLTISAAADDDCVTIDVRDSGKGLSAHTLDNVLNPFLSADPYQQPIDWQEVGMGLSVCRLIAHHHGATIEALANEGAGTTFRLRWPKA